MKQGEAGVVLSSCSSHCPLPRCPNRVVITWKEVLGSGRPMRAHAPDSSLVSFSVTQGLVTFHFSAFTWQTRPIQSLWPSAGLTLKQFLIKWGY